MTRGCEAFDYLCNIGLNYPTNWTIADYERVIEPSNSKESKNSSGQPHTRILREGSDYDSCVLAKDDQIISCDEDEECNVMRKQTTLEDSSATCISYPLHEHIV